VGGHYHRRLKKGKIVGATTPRGVQSKHGGIRTRARAKEVPIARQIKLPKKETKEGENCPDREGPCKQKKEQRNSSRAPISAKKEGFASLEKGKKRMQKNGKNSQRAHEEWTVSEPYAEGRPREWG